jgi:hypothetical protein
MGNLLEWVAAIGGVAATIGTWLGPVRARWKLAAEQIRAGRDRRENEMHRTRFAEVWSWQREETDREERVRRARWFGEWTGADKPFRGGLDPGPLTPGLHSGSAVEAYQNYVDFLGEVYEPGRMGSPRPVLGGPALAGAGRRRRPWARLRGTRRRAIGPEA